jgi:hypothetical protein
MSILHSCQPRNDIIQGSFNPEIFTASISQVASARAYLDEQREGNDQIILDLLEVWGEEAETPEARDEARALLFGLRQ